MSLPTKQEPTGKPQSARPGILGVHAGEDVNSFLQRLEAERTLSEGPVSRLLSRWYDVTACGMEDQEQGRDFWTVPKRRTAPRQSVEVKRSTRSCWHFLQLHGPGLAEPGWLYSSKADVFALVTTSEQGEPYCLLLEAEALRSRVQALLEGGASVVNGAPQDSMRPGGKGLWARSLQIQGAERIYWLREEALKNDEAQPGTHPAGLDASRALPRRRRE